MANKKRSFLLFMVGNLAAAYAPGIFWLPSLPGQGASPWLGPLSPILLVILFFNTENPLVCGALFVAFLLLVTALSALFYRLSPARIIVPGLLFVISLIQGLLVSEILHGIDAIGHS